MTLRRLALLAVIASPLLLAASATQSKTIAQMRWQRRVLLVAAPSASDPRLAAQRRALETWREGAAARDLTLVELIGNHVTGASDAAAALRARYDLPAADFAVLLIGKDGHVARREREPQSGATLEAVVDAMPMRRAGQR